MMYHNILSNPTLQTSEDNLHVEKIHVLDYPPQFIYHPIQWKTTVIPTIRGQYTKRADDLHIIPTVWPQTVNGERLLTIEANTKHFVVQLEQFAIPFKAHQRYLVKVLFTPAVQPMGAANPTDLVWRLMVNCKGCDMAYTDGFQSAASIGEWGQQRSALLVMHSYEDQSVDVSVEFWSKFGNLDKQIYIHSIEALEVESTYGEEGSVHEIGTPSTEPDTPDPPDPEPGPDTPPAPIWMLPLFVGIIGVIIGAIVYSFIQPRLAAMEVHSMEEFINSLYAIPALVPIAFTMPIVLYLTEALKRLRVKYLPAVEWLSPYVIALFLVFFCLGSYTVAQTYAYDNVFKDVAKVIVQLIDVFGPYLLTALLGQVTVAAVHKRVRSIGVPGFDQ